MSPAAPKGDAPLIVRCPCCGGDSVYAPTNPHRPFCSASCRNLDLGAWASEQYRMGAGPGDPDEDEHPPAASRPTND